MRIGIYGGTFDPPHIGHINILKAFLEQFNFDLVYVIPVNSPPHKSLKSAVTAQDRLNMSCLAFEGVSKKIVVSDLEIKREGKSYTADTIKHFKENGCDNIYFLCGTDMLLTLDSWYKPEYIFANATIVYARREGDEKTSAEIEIKLQEYNNKYNAKIIPLKTKVIEISSTEIRNSLISGDSSHLLPSVLDYINSHNLYKDR